jgi:hypothetical protein
MSLRTRRGSALLAPLAVALLVPFALAAQSTTRPVLPPARAVVDSTDPVALLVARLDLERYKATIKGLTQFGDRRQGTARNRAALDWIEAQLASYGCTTTERLTYTYTSGTPRIAAPAAADRPVVPRPPAGLTTQGGGRPRGVRTRTGVNSDSLAQPDARLRALNAEPSVDGERQQVWCTKVGTTRPDEMYIVGAHMDGIGWGEGANDDGSGTALVMELARIFSSPDVHTERSIRFILFNNEETEQRQALQGVENPKGSGRYPEPRWLGMIQHDMMLFDHGPPRPDGTMSPVQRPEADVNIEFQSAAKQAKASAELAWLFHQANEKYATDYPAQVGPHMTNTDSGPFQDLVPAISLRENERGIHTGSGWNPHWHQPSDRYDTFSDADFRLGLNAAQTTLGAVGRLVGATLKKAP